MGLHCETCECELTKKRPTHCVCDAGTWCVQDIPPPCAAYKAADGAPDSYCINCEHDKACHAESVEKIEG